jgi:hypothetical protein
MGGDWRYVDLGEADKGWLKLVGLAEEQKGKVRQGQSG